MKNPEPIGNYQSKWGEGPTWHNGCLLYVDIHGHCVVEFNPTTGDERKWAVNQQVGFVVPCRSGKLLCGGDNGLFFLDRESGVTTDIYDPEPNLPNNRFNDGKCSPDGRLFAGTIAEDKSTGTARLYRLDPNLSTTEIYGPVTNSNGLAWTADQKIFFYIDTPSKEVKAFDYDGESGQISNCRVVIRTNDQAGVPDGMTIDNEDHLWIAFCHGGHVARYNPKTGAEVERVDIPAHETTSCAFGGPEGTDLYISTGLAKNRNEEFGGRIFVIRDLPVGGAPTAIFNDD
jgi:sugar lactone lactonase YvrE